MDKEDVAHLYNGILAIKRNEIELFVVRSDSKKQVSYDIACMWNLKKRVQINLFSEHKQSYRCRKQTYGSQGVRRGEG